MALENFLQKFADQIINPIIAILVGIAVLYFLWGIIEFISKTDNEEARTTGKKHIIWGLVGFLIIFGVVGIINIIQSFFESGPIGPLR